MCDTGEARSCIRGGGGGGREVGVGGLGGGDPIPENRFFIERGDAVGDNIIDKKKQDVFCIGRGVQFAV